jgi:DNA-directed RNA polymerase subunit RPC12/RpoP
MIWERYECSKCKTRLSCTFYKDGEPWVYTEQTRCPKCGSYSWHYFAGIAEETIPIVEERKLRE